MLKIKGTNLKKIEDLTNKNVEWINNSIMINNDKIENKTEIIVIFNSKGKYEMSITFENNYVFKYNMICEENSNNKFEFKPEEIYRYLFNETLENKTEIIGIFNLKGKYEMKITFENNYVFKYNMICEEDSKDKLELKPEDLNRYEFNESLENENFAFVSHKTNSFNVKNKETFIFQGTHKYYKLNISLQSKDNNITSYEAQKYIRVKPREDETKYEIEVFFNKKGKYDLSFIFKDLDTKNSIGLKYYLTYEQDLEQLNEFPIEEIQRVNFYNLFPFFKYLNKK